MGRAWVVAAIAAVLLVAGALRGQERQAKGGGAEGTVSFKEEVMPIIRKHCLPCHAVDNFNPSELSLDTYEDLMAGGKHGTPVVPGNASESIIVQKLGEDPPFGDRMPLVRKKDRVPNKLTEQQIETIRAWVDQGAQNN
jgi:hypothetical protein